MSDKIGKEEHQLAGVQDIKSEDIQTDEKTRDVVHTTLIEEALAQREAESALPLIKLVKLYYPGLLYGMGLSLALVMEGMDTGMINNLFGQTAFQNRFGTLQPNGRYAIPANWQAGINNASSGGQIIGLLLNGWAASRWGSKRVYMAGMVGMTATIFVLVFAQNLPMLLAGNLLCGIPWGVFQIITTAYAAEIVPPALRGFLTTWVSMCWGTGSFLASGILRGSLDINGNWAWRVPYTLQWIWPVPLFFLAWFAPESPYYLVRNERYDEARAIVHRIARPGHRTERMVDAQIEIMKQANEMEKLNAKTVSFMDCFRGSNFKRTLIGIMAWLIQILNGEALASYATVFLRIAGMPETRAFDFNMGIQSTSLVATGTAMYLIGRVGRRPLYLYGIVAMGILMLITGIIGSIPTDSTAIGIAVILIFVRLTFKVTLGPCCYTIVAETPSSRVRSQTMTIGRTSYVIGGIVMNQITPRMLNADAWNWGAKAGYFFLGFDVVFFAYLFFNLPETRNRTSAEIEYLFQNKVPARKFKGYEINPYDLAHTTQEGTVEAVDATIAGDTRARTT